MANIVITGASRGIGLATALELSRAGHQVIATMRNPASSPELGQIAETDSLPIRIEAMDVDSDASVNACFSRIHSQVAVDGLVNNAGVERFGAVEETPLAEFRRCMETNYFGSIRCIQAVAPGMRSRGHGTIVNVTSVAGKISVAPMAPYAASKSAIEAMSEALAQEMKAFGVRVAIVEPGIIDTRMARNIEALPSSTVYPHTKRIAALFKASLAGGAATPGMVAEKIREVIESGTWQLRHAASPDAQPFLGWRASLTDEQWVDWGALDEKAWVAAVKRDFGMDVVL
ncbi:MAG: SDR family oxidoreductase [Bryobacteraceae bacterium]|jgi:NAD(P)-dependent dehydrogenase (short-subunit alcohol dehydrogenase family)